MLSAYEYGEFSVVEEFADTFFHLCGHGFRRRRFCHGLYCGNAFCIDFGVGFNVVQFHVGRCFQKGFRAFVSPFYPCAGSIVWYREDGYGRFLVVGKFIIKSAVNCFHGSI